MKAVVLDKLFCPLPLEDVESDFFKCFDVILGTSRSLVLV